MRTNRFRLEVAVSMLFSVSAAFDAGAQQNANSFVWKNDYTSLLEFRVSKFECNGCGIAEFVDRFTRATGVAACLEQSQPGPMRSGGLSIEMSDATPREILEAATQQMPEYTWLPSETNIVNIVPVNEATDPNSRMNTVMDYSTQGPVPLSKAIFQLHSHTGSMSVPLTGVVNAKFDYRGEPTVDLALEQTTFLDVLNQIFARAGNGYYYRSSGKFITWGFLFPEQVQLSSHEAARNSTGFADLQRKYLAAIDEAPFATLKMRIGAEYARRLIGRGGADLETGLAMLYSILEELPGSTAFPNTTQSVLEGIMEGLEQSGAREQGTAFLADLIKSKTFDGEIGDAILDRALVGHQIDSSDPKGTMRRLIEMRAVLPDRPSFHVALEQTITWRSKAIEQQAEFESRRGSR